MRSYQNYTLNEATRKLEQYCAYQERCHKEVRGKLLEMRMIPEAIDHIITHLIQENYLNEERFARSFARGKFRIKHWGRNRIIKELKQREISKYAIASGLSEITSEQYEQVFAELANKKWQQIKEKNLKKKQRQFANYFLYRGWESELIYPRIKELSGKT